MNLDELKSAVGYWHALTISRMEPLVQGAMFEMLAGKVEPSFLLAIQEHFLELIKGEK
jgi:hypothetical protein